MTKLPTKNKSDNICCLNTGEYPGSNTNNLKHISELKALIAVYHKLFFFLISLTKTNKHPANL